MSGTSSQSMSRKRRLTITAVVIGVLLVGGGGAAFAFWTSSGTGSGVATTGTTTAFTVESTETSGGPLTPGGDSETVAFTVTNPDAGSQMLSTVVATVAASDGSEWTTADGCSALDYTVGTPEISYGEIAGGSTVSGTVTITMNDLETPQDGCKNADVPIYFAAN
jgi:hypothetical protein